RAIIGEQDGAHLSGCGVVVDLDLSSFFFFLSFFFLLLESGCVCGEELSAGAAAGALEFAGAAAGVLASVAGVAAGVPAGVSFDAPFAGAAVDEPGGFMRASGSLSSAVGSVTGATV